MQTQLAPFSDGAKSLKSGTLYRHYSGKEYKLLFVGRHSETLEELVIYQALYGDFDVWCRPLEMFIEKIEKDGKTIMRFSQLS